MKDCVNPKDFNRFLEDSLNPESLARLEAHCKTCGSCARKLESWKELKEKLHDASCIIIPDGFRKKVMSRISREKILPVSSTGGVRRGLAFALVLIITLYSVFRPFLRPLLSELASNLFKSLSALLYNSLSAVGIDPGVLIRLFGSIMANLDSLLPVFLTSTALMILAFILLIIKGRAAHQSG